MGVRKALAVLTACAFASGDAAAQAARLSEWLETFRPVLVKIDTSGGPDEYCRSEGSGFVVGRDDTHIYVATASHVVPIHESCDGKLSIEGRFASDPGTASEMSLLQRGIDDVAILTLDVASDAAPGSSMPFCSVKIGKAKKPIADLFYLGYLPGDESPLPYDALLETSVSADGSRQRIRASVNHGFSGAPVFDKDMTLVGVLKERIDKDEYGNDVVQAAYIAPITSFVTMLKSIPMRDAGDLPCGVVITAGPLDMDQRPDVIEVPLQLAEMNDKHKNASFAELLQWRGGPGLRFERSYRRVYNAEPGFLFSSVVKTALLSHNRPAEPVPSTICDDERDCIRIIDGGKKLEVRFRLSSGPSIDQTRGWIDMIIVSRQQRKPSVR